MPQILFYWSNGLLLCSYNFTASGFRQLELWWLVLGHILCYRIYGFILEHILWLASDSLPPVSLSLIPAAPLDLPHPTVWEAGYLNLSLNLLQNSPLFLDLFKTVNLQCHQINKSCIRSKFLSVFICYL